MTNLSVKQELVCPGDGLEQTQYFYISDKAFALKSFFRTKMEWWHKDPKFWLAGSKEINELLLLCMQIE